MAETPKSTFWGHGPQFYTFLSLFTIFGIDSASAQGGCIAYSTVVLLFLHLEFRPINVLICSVVQLAEMNSPARTIAGSIPTLYIVPVLFLFPHFFRRTVQSARTKSFPVAGRLRMLMHVSHVWRYLSVGVPQRKDCSRKTAAVRTASSAVSKPGVLVVKLVLRSHTEGGDVL